MRALGFSKTRPDGRHVGATSEGMQMKVVMVVVVVVVVVVMIMVVIVIRSGSGDDAKGE